MLSTEAMDIAAKIGRFYLKKNNGDKQAARNEILNLRISEIQTGPQDIELLLAADYLEEKGMFGKAVATLREKGRGVDKGVQIKTARPGLLIGARGRNIEELEQFLGLRICIIEDMDNPEGLLTVFTHDETYEG